MSHRHAPRGPIKARDPLVPTKPLVPQCSARSKRSQVQCRRYAIAGGTVCIMHGGSAPQVKQAARERLLALQNPAIDALGWLVGQREFPSATYAAARDILDRTEGKPAESVAVAHSGGFTISHETPE